MVKAEDTTCARTLGKEPDIIEDLRNVQCGWCRDLSSVRLGEETTREVRFGLLVVQKYELRAFTYQISHESLDF